MATQEKLLKSLEALKQLINSNQTSDQQSRKKEKIQHCNFIGEAMLNPTIKIAKNFSNLLSFTMDVLLQLCDDPESDIRMTADECLNKIIRAMSNGSVTKVQIELHKEIKHNGPARSLRAAIWRFALLAHHIRPHKGKPYVVNLIPCIVKILERNEELIHETLANSMPKIMAALGCFTMDNDIKSLIKACMGNVSSSSAVIRRTTASCLLTICLNCRKPYIFITYVLNALLDNLVPVQDSHTTSQILGFLGCIKSILPHIDKTEKDLRNQSTFSGRRDISDNILSCERLLQVYELCLYYTCHCDHNIANASLETLNTILQNCPQEMATLLLSEHGIGKSRIQLFETSMKKMRSPSQLSVATTLVLEDNLLIDNDLSEASLPDIEKWIDESKLSVINVHYVRNIDECDQSITNPDGIRLDDMDKSFDYSNINIGTIQEQYAESMKSESVADQIDKLILSENSSEKSYSQKIDEKSTNTLDDIFCLDIDVGDYLDKNIPLIYCARHITKQFLLSGIPKTMVPDKTIRVSTKNLALNCLSSIIQMYPKVLLMYMDKNCAKETVDAKDDLCKQQISDILLFESHCDPQLRGAIRVIISCFIKAVLLQSYGNFDEWIAKNICVNDVDTFDIKNLTNIILTGLKDESSTCSRQTLASLNISLKYLLESDCSLQVLEILHYLPILAKDPYWLVKVRLVEAVTDLHYVTIHHVFNSKEFQSKVIHNILLELLKDDDQRVRNAASSGIVKIIPLLFFEQQYPKETTVTCKAIYYKNKYLPSLSNNEIDGNVNKKCFVNNMPFPFNISNCQHSDTIEQSLSRITLLLFENLLITTSKHYIYGCIETLNILSNTYPTTVYKSAWNCFKNFSIQNDNHILQRSASMIANASIQETMLSSSADLLNISIHLLTNGIVGYDLNCHLNLMKLTGNVIAGKWLESIKPPTEMPTESPRELWDILSDKTLTYLSEQFLNHVVKMLNIFSYVLEEVTPTIPQSKPVLPNLPSASNLSPIKRKKSDAGDKKILSPGKIIDKDDKSDKRIDQKISAMGYFAGAPHYMKIYEILKAAYNNYKITLDSDASENFLNLLKATLNTLSQILEIATLNETGRIAEEILSYLKLTFSLESTATVQCVQQLLKSLFGTNMSVDVDEFLKYLFKKEEPEDIENNNSGFFYNVFQQSYDDLSLCINNFSKVSKVDCDGDSTVMGYLHRKENKKVPCKSLDKILANYIRIFEPMVIKSLKHYTITSNVKLQCQVLQLLSQLVQLRVNYCLLDSEQIFIGFVLKQFEFIEEGQIPLCEELIPKIFQFLVHLSYGKQHSKSIIIIPKIIQLCDGLMASGQSPSTHCIPALKPIVEDVFLLRNKSNTPDFKELETTREVLISMLLRLIEYKDIIELITLILNECKYCDSTEKWPRWSKQIYDVFLPLMKHNRIRLDEDGCIEAARKMIFTFHPSVFKNVDDILIMLFAEPPHKDDPSINRYIGKVLILLLILSQQKEEKLLLKIIENQSEFAPQSVFQNITLTPDPLNVTKSSDIFDQFSPEVVFLRFVFRFVDIVVAKCVEIALKNEEDDFIVQQFSILLLYFTHMFQSGNYCKITNMAISIINEEIEFEEEEKLPIDELNNNFLKLKYFYPTLSFQWCLILTLLNYNERKYWSSVMQLMEVYGINRQINYGALAVKKQCINMEIVRIGGTIVFSDYLSENILTDGEQMSWLLVNNIELLIDYHNETPIYDLLQCVHRNPAASGLVIQAIATKCADNPVVTFKTKILKSLENVHPSQTGCLLLFLIPKLLNVRQLAISRLVAAAASRKIEFLLTQSIEDVTRQMPKDELTRLMDVLVTLKLSRKHETLISLLNKLATQFYDLSPLEFDQKRPIKPEYIKNLHVDQTWYTSQVKNRCRILNIGIEAAELLSKLRYDDLINIMSHKDFNKLVMADCIKWSVHQKKLNGDLSEVSLLKACLKLVTNDVANLCSIVPKPHQVYKPEGRDLSVPENKYTNRLTDLFVDEIFWKYLNNLFPPITEYIKSLSTFPDHKISETQFEEFAKVAVVCLETVTFQTHVNKDHFNVNFIDTCLTCANVILKENYICSNLSLETYITWFCSAVNSMYRLLTFLLLDSEPMPTVSTHNLNETLSNAETKSAGHAVYQLSCIVCWLERVNMRTVNIPKCLLNNIKSIVISLARLPLVNSYILTPPTAWKSEWDVQLSGPFSIQVPPLPIEYLQDIEILEEFIFRITLLGWTSRQQFEETWVCLLSVLSASPTEDSVPEEINAITHSTSLAVQAITSLLLQTLYYPQPGNRNVSRLIHVPRDAMINDSSHSIKKLKLLHRSFALNYMSQNETLPRTEMFSSVFHKPNLEKVDEGYSYSQLSVEYLQISAKIVESVDGLSAANDFYKMREKMLNDIGLDINSCLQFLLDLYTQWLKSEEIIPLRLLQEVIKSILMISDIFNEKSQFQWMLDVCLDLYRFHAIEDEIVHQYIVLGICKATAVLSPDLETYELVKKMITQSRKSAFLSARFAGMHGLLYILQMCVLGNTTIGGVSEEMQLFLPIAMEYINFHMGSNSRVLNQSHEHILLIWSITFYIIENVDVPHIEEVFIETVLNSALSSLTEATLNTTVHIPLIKGLERIVIKKQLPKKIMSRIMNFCLEKLRNSNPSVALPVVQLLFTSMYIEYSDQLDKTTTEGIQSNPDHLVQTIEKISVVFDRIKKAYPFEVEILCSSISIVLNDFFPPSDILTKVISEYLSPQQRHPMQLSKVVFQIFENTIQQSQLSLLQDWVVFSLTNFTQSFSIGMATWCLTCFFISASSNKWLRNMFPYVQKRMGRYEYEDRKIMCIAGTDFFNNLTTDLQKKTFVDTLQRVKDQVDMPFNELLGCL